jgi:hypothetical protein
LRVRIWRFTLSTSPRWRDTGEGLLDKLEQTTSGAEAPEVVTSRLKPCRECRSGRFVARSAALDLCNQPEIRADD